MLPFIRSLSQLAAVYPPKTHMVLSANAQYHWYVVPVRVCTRTMVDVYSRTYTCTYVRTRVHTCTYITFLIGKGHMCTYGTRVRTMVLGSVTQCIPVFNTGTDQCRGSDLSTLGPGAGMAVCGGFENVGGDLVPLVVARTLVDSARP